MKRCEKSLEMSDCKAVEYLNSFHVMYHGLFFKPAVVNIEGSKVVLVCDISPDNAVFFENKEV